MQGLFSRSDSRITGMQNGLARSVSLRIGYQSALLIEIHYVSDLLPHCLHQKGVRNGSPAIGDVHIRRRSLSTPKGGLFIERHAQISLLYKYSKMECLGREREE
jgi:hypothetical protein